METLSLEEANHVTYYVMMGFCSCAWISLSFIITILVVIYKKGPSP